MTKQRGLTLIEVMVAVAILAFALSALVRMTGESANTLSYLEKKTYAQWVANNQVSKVEISPTWPAVGRSEGKESMGGLPLYWEMKVSNTESVDLRRIDISVKQERKDDHPVYQLTAFTHRP